MKVKITINERNQTLIMLALFTLWPFSNFLNANRGESYAGSMLGIYTISVLTIVFVGLYVCRTIFTKILDRQRIYTIYAISVFSFFCYPIIYLIAGSLFGGYYLKSWMVFFVIMVSLAWVLSKFTLFRHLMLSVSIVVVIIPLTQFLNFYVKSLLATKPAVSDIFKRSVDSLDGGGAPSVYYVILDQYGRADVLDALYGFDNTEFIAELERLGFYVAGKSTSNYPYTHASLTSTLAMEYHFIGDTTVAKIAASAQILYRNMGPVYNFFRTAGYETAVLKFSGTNCGDDYPEYCFPHGGLYFGDLESSLIKLTPINSLIHVLFDDFLVPKYFELSDTQKLLEARESGYPIFAFIHALIPHGPYRFNRECQPVNPSEYPNVAGYLAQIECANKATLKMIDTISKKNPNSIIIIQSDHGPKELINWDDLKTMNETWSQSFSNLNAWRFPPQYDCQKYLSPDMTSINTFRIVLGCITGTQPELLADRWFFNTGDNSDTQFFTEITAP